jgi:hypothetical protein
LNNLLLLLLKCWKNIMPHPRICDVFQKWIITQTCSFSSTNEYKKIIENQLTHSMQECPSSEVNLFEKFSPYVEPEGT